MSKSEQRAGRAGRTREKTGKFRKNPAKKRKVDSLDDSKLNDSTATLNESVEMEEAEPAEKTHTEAGKQAETKDEESEPTEGAALDDTQTSDACDADPLPEADAASTTSSCKPKKTVTIDVRRLEELLESIVFTTKGWSLEKMLRLYTKLAKLADRYSKLWIRTDLIQV